MGVWKNTRVAVSGVRRDSDELIALRRGVFEKKYRSLGFFSTWLRGVPKKLALFRRFLRFAQQMYARRGDV